MGLRVSISSDETPSRIATLCDSPDPLPTFNFALNNVRVLQVQDFIRAAYVSIFPRNNKKNGFSFEVWRNADQDRPFETSLEALLFAIDHMDDVPETGLFQLVLSDGHSSGTRWIRGGVSNVELVKYKGMSLNLRYTIVGGQFAKKNPNT